MASPQSSSLSLHIYLFIITLSFFLHPTVSTSRLAALARKTGLRVTLNHVDSGKNYTKFERLQRAIKRSEHRLNKLSSMSLSTSDGESQQMVASRINSGNGEFLMQLSIGTPPASFSAIMDTGSDLIWTQCKPCTKCFDQPTPIFDPTKSSSFSSMPCSSKLCKTLPTSTCDGNNCEYVYTYGDYSSTQGVLSTETFTFGEVTLPEIGFGCGDDNQGSGFGQGSGLVGLGRGSLSLISQLGVPKFSYCLTSIDESNKSSVLLIGSLADSNVTGSRDEISITTSLIQNPSQPSFYYLSLEGITVGGSRLPIKKSKLELQDDGSGGLIIDSGTTITYLEESVFKLVKDEIISQTKMEVDVSGSTGLDLCFTLPSSTEEEVEVPSLTFNFDGGDLKLEGENYMIADSSVGLMCLAMGSSNGMSILGNVQQQNMLVVHDLDKERLSFVPTQCDQL